MKKIKFKIIMAVVLAFMVNGAAFAQSQDFKEFLKLFTKVEKPDCDSIGKGGYEYIPQNYVKEFISNDGCPNCGDKKAWWDASNLFKVGKYYVATLYNRCDEDYCFCIPWMYVYSQQGEVIKQNMVKGYTYDMSIFTFSETCATVSPFSYKLVFGVAKKPVSMDDEIVECNVDTYKFTISPEGKIIRKIIKKNEDLIWKYDTDGKSTFHKPSKELMEAIRAQEAANK